MAKPQLDSATRSAVVQEAIFRPRNAMIIGATILGSFALPPFAPFIAAGGAAALFCVERDPEACHRWLIAQRLAERHGVVVEHLRPT